MVRIEPDSAASRKARGAFFTPEPVARFISDWALRDAADTVLDPSAGDAAFLVPAARRLRDLGASLPRVDGIEIHEQSARLAQARVRDVGGDPAIRVSDFFEVAPHPTFDAVVGNPPYIRYQEFSGDARTRSRAAALKGGVALTALASSWAAFTVHASLFLRPGGRMGLVLPAELLSVNYAAAVRQYLFDRFSRVEVVLFAEQVFPEAEADVVLLLADGYGEGPTDHAVVWQARNADDLAPSGEPRHWTPANPSEKWTGMFGDADAAAIAESLCARGDFAALEAWGDTTLGMVTGNNRYFTLAPERVAELGLEERDLLPLSPPGSSHLRGLELSTAQMKRLGNDGKATWLFRPTDPLSDTAAAYVDAGHRAGVDSAYKCRVRNPWYRVPLQPVADLLLTCMNADTARLTTNSARVRHLNSVHGVYLKDDVRSLGRELLALASLNSVTLYSAEAVGRSYGGGILKVEPREADRWLMPSAQIVAACADDLRAIKRDVSAHLRRGALIAAVELVDEVLVDTLPGLSIAQITHVRNIRAGLAERRAARGRKGGR